MIQILVQCHTCTGGRVTVTPAIQGTASNNIIAFQPSMHVVTRLNYRFLLYRWFQQLLCIWTLQGRTAKLLL